MALNVLEQWQWWQHLFVRARVETIGASVLLFFRFLWDFLVLNPFSDTESSIL